MPGAQAPAQLPACSDAALQARAQQYESKIAHRSALNIPNVAAASEYRPGHTFPRNSAMIVSRIPARGRLEADGQCSRVHAACNMHASVPGYIADSSQFQHVWTRCLRSYPRDTFASVHAQTGQQSFILVCTHDCEQHVPSQVEPGLGRHGGRGRRGRVPRQPRGIQ